MVLPRTTANIILCFINTLLLCLWQNGFMFTHRYIHVYVCAVWSCGLYSRMLIYVLFFERGSQDSRCHTESIHEVYSHWKQRHETFLTPNINTYNIIKHNNKYIYRCFLLIWLEDHFDDLFILFWSWSLPKQHIIFDEWCFTPEIYFQRKMS